MKRVLKINFKKFLILIATSALILLLITPPSIIIFTKTTIFENWTIKKINTWFLENIEGKAWIGRIHIHYLPPKIIIENVEIYDKKSTLFLKCKKLEIIPDPLSLLKKKIDFEEIALTSPILHLHILRSELVNLPLLKKIKSSMRSKPLVKTLSITNGTVIAKIEKTAPWDIYTELKNVNIDITGEENKIFEIRVLSRRGHIKIKSIQKDIDNLKIRTSIKLKRNITTVNIKNLVISAGNTSLSLNHSLLTIKGNNSIIFFGNYSTSSPLEMISVLVESVPLLEGYQECSGIIAYNNGEAETDSYCKFKKLVINQRFIVGNLYSRIIYSPQKLELRDATIEGGGGKLDFNFTLHFDENMHIGFSGKMNGVEFSKIFYQLGFASSGVFFHGYGPISLTGTLKPIKLNGELNTIVRNFKVFTGDWRKKSSSLVLKVNTAAVKSELEINNKYFRFKNGYVKFGRTSITTDAKLLFNKTLRIAIKARSFHGKDLKKLAGLPLKGRGTLHCNIRGRMKSPKVSGLAKIAGFSLGSINYGNVSFKLLYDGGKKISLPEIIARKGKSSYRVSDASILFRKKKDGGTLIEGKIYSKSLYISDLKNILNFKNELIKNIDAKTWGNIGFRYEPDIHKIKIISDLSLSKISIYGEKFKGGKLKFKLFDRKLIVENFAIIGEVGEVEINGVKNEDDSLKFNINIPRFNSRFLRALNLRKYGINFKASTNFSLRGTIANPVIENGLINITNTIIGERHEGNSTITFTLFDNILAINTFLFNGKIVWTSRTEINRDGQSDILISVEGITLTEKQLKFITAPYLKTNHQIKLEGNIKASINSLWDKFKMNGQMEFTSLNLKIGEIKFSNVDPVKIEFSEKSFIFKNLKLKGEETQLKISGGISTTGPSVTLRGKIDLKILKKFTEEVKGASGYVYPKFIYSGRWANTYLLGEMEVDCHYMRLRRAALRFDNVKGALNFDRDTIAINLRGNLSGGQFLSTGTVKLKSLKPQFYEVYTQFNDVNLHLMEGMIAGIEGELMLSRKNNGNKHSYATISGDVWVNNLKYTKDFILSQEMEEAIFKSKAKKAKSYNIKKEAINFDITLHSSENLFVKNNIANARFKINETRRQFRLVGNTEFPILLGDVLVTRGNLKWKGKTFNIKKGVINFNDKTRVNPFFDISATGNIRNYQIMLHAIGRTDNFRLYYSSQPELAEEDIILLIQFNMTREEMARIENAQTVAAEVASQAVGLDSKVKQLIPIIDQFQITSQYSKITNKVEPRLVIGKSITDRIKISATSGITDTESLEKGTYFKAVLEYKVSDSISLQAAYDNTKGPEVGQESQQLGNLGIDIKWRIEF